MSITISFSDLKHTEHSCNSIPIGITTIAANAMKKLGQKIKVNIFRFPEDFILYLEEEIPQIACFSSYSWNFNIANEFAKRIKNKSPNSITIFGGPNFPIDNKDQEAFLNLYPDIDFYIEREGEDAFVELINVLFECSFNLKYFKTNQIVTPNCRYLDGTKIVQGNLLPRLNNLDEIPSPYLSGLCDYFLSSKLIPLLQTTRGCPFTCSYCQEGNGYFSSINRFSQSRIREEIEYIAQRTDNPNLLLADSNFGMYEEDLDICRDVASTQEKYQWPKYFSGIAGKNNKSRILESASIIKGSSVSAAVQSTDKQVLKNINRQNVSWRQMIEIVKGGESTNSNSISEVILCLPGDTKKAHYRSILDLIEAEISIVRSHQFIMLIGSETSTKNCREQYGMQTRFRVVPKTVSSYQLFGQSFVAPEIDEICVANNTMTFEDYIDCRLFNLTVEIFYNDCVFSELLKFLKQNNLSISTFILNVHNRTQSETNQLSEVYTGFLRDTKELFPSLKEAEEFLQQPDVIDRYQSGELGNNEQLIYRAVAIIKHMKELHRFAFEVAETMLKEEGCKTEQTYGYLTELSLYSLLRKEDIISVDTCTEEVFHYDFIGLSSINFDDDPASWYRPEGLKIVFSHSKAQKELISKYINLYGYTYYGLGNILSSASNVSALYRGVNLI